MKCSVDPFSKKDWYDVKAPSIFTHRNVGKTLVSRTQGTKVMSLSLFYSLFSYYKHSLIALAGDITRFLVGSIDLGLRNLVQHLMVLRLIAIVVYRVLCCSIWFAHFETDYVPDCFRGPETQSFRGFAC